MKSLICVLIIYGIHTSLATCVFHANLRGKWNGTKTSLSFSNIEVNNFRLPENPVLEDEVGTTYICVDNSPSQYVIRSSRMFQSGPVIGLKPVYVYTCIFIEHVSSNNLTLVQPTETHPGNTPKYCKLISIEDNNITVSRICDMKPPYKRDSYRTLFRDDELTTYMYVSLTTVESTSGTTVESTSGTEIPTPATSSSDTAITISIVVVIVAVLVAVVVVVMVHQKVRNRSNQRQHKENSAITSTVDDNTVKAISLNELWDDKTDDVTGPASDTAWNTVADVYTLVVKKKKLPVSTGEEEYEEVQSPLDQTEHDDGMYITY